MPLLRPEERALLERQPDWQALTERLLQWASGLICAYGVENNGAEYGHI